MKLTKRRRIALEILGPPFFGVVVFLVCGVVATVVENGIRRFPWRMSVDDLRAIAGVLLFSYVIAGVQSLVFAAVMEWRFSRGLNPRSWRSVMLSSALGFASGAVIVPVLDDRTDERLVTMATLGALGLVVGFAMGVLIKLGSRADGGATQPM